MGRRSDLVVRSFHGALAGLLAYTIVAQTILTASEDRSIVNMYSYFTIQSNVLVFGTSFVLLLNPHVSGPVWRAFRLAALCGITTTGIVYATVIARRDMVFIVWPVLWLVYTMLRGAFLDPVFTGLGGAPSHYPYRFLDVDRTSTVEIVLAIVVISIVLIGLGLVYIRAERWLDERAMRTA